jgi:hypothetical protein
MKTQTQQASAATKTEEPLLDGIQPGLAQPLLDIGDCVDDTHPTLAGRVRVRTQTREQWLPCLATVRARCGDRLLVAQLGDGSSLVVGVVDGLRERSPQPARVDNTRRIRDDEAIVIESSAGEPLVEVRAEAGRTTLRVLSATTRIEGAGKLELAGESIEVVATKGPIVLSANEDVRVTGETINLN